MDDTGMLVVGYSSELGVLPGQPIQFMVSCQAESYSAQVVRLRHGDINPRGPGFRATRIVSPVDGTYPGRIQKIFPGSYVTVDDGRTLTPLKTLTACCWIYPTKGGGGPQAIISRWLALDEAGFCLFITPQGDLALKLGDGNGKSETVRSGVSLALREWHYVACAVDLDRSETLLYQYPRRVRPGSAGRVIASQPIRLQTAADPKVALVIAAACTNASGERGTTTDFFNGKIDRPAILRRALNESELDGMAHHGVDLADADLVAAWDFSAEIAGTAAIDRSRNAHHGVIVNQPTRGVTGYNWSAREQRFTQALDEYGAIHFHEDDLDDAGWEEDIRLTIPSDWHSGIYALRLSVGEFEDYVPFVVRPRKTGPRRQIAFLVPTLTYLAYANDHMTAALGRAEPAPGSSVDAYLAKHATPYEKAVYRYITANRLQCMYERHADGSPVCYASRRRPLGNVRPRYNKANLEFRYPHLLSCDLYLVDWLDEKKFEYDTIDDELLHAEGESLLDRYKVVMTGSHPEYWTYEMLIAMKRYLDGGGHLMYMGGNGFYWVTSLDANRPHLMEVRRGVAGVRTWSSEPGEWFHSMTGKMGGLWRSSGLAPQSIAGVGFAAAGLGAAPYRRTEASYRPEVAFIFEGVDDEILGDFGLHMGGAAGWEIDRADLDLGTPSNAIVLASSFGHSDSFQRAIEELQEVGPGHGGTQSPFVRADLTYFDTPNQGAVFSVGSMTWCGSLSENAYKNNISRITENVLRRFASS